jgi:PAS domain S-box-containing protein
VSEHDEAVILSDFQRRTIDVNPAFQNIYGYTREEVLGKKLDFLNPPGHHHLRRNSGVAAQSGSWSSELPVLKKIGTGGWTYTK